MAGYFYKWIGNSNVEGFEESNGHNNSILVSEWIGALCIPRYELGSKLHLQICQNFK